MTDAPVADAPPTPERAAHGEMMGATWLEDALSSHPLSWRDHSRGAWIARFLFLWMAGVPVIMFVPLSERAMDGMVFASSTAGFLLLGSFLVSWAFHLVRTGCDQFSELPVSRARRAAMRVGYVWILATLMTSVAAVALDAPPPVYWGVIVALGIGAPLIFWHLWPFGGSFTTRSKTND